MIELILGALRLSDLLRPGAEGFPGANSHIFSSLEWKTILEP